jgi:hypothetical protein
MNCKVARCAGIKSGYIQTMTKTGSYILCIIAVVLLGISSSAHAVRKYRYPSAQKRGAEWKKSRLPGGKSLPQFKRKSTSQLSSTTGDRYYQRPRATQK